MVYKNGLFRWAVGTGQYILYIQPIYGQYTAHIITSNNVYVQLYRTVNKGLPGIEHMYSRGWWKHRNRMKKCVWVAAFILHNKAEEDYGVIYNMHCSEPHLLAMKGKFREIFNQCFSSINFYIRREIFWNMGAEVHGISWIRTITFWISRRIPNGNR